MQTCEACGLDYADDAPHAEMCEADATFECADCSEVFDSEDEFDDHDCPADEV